MEVVEKSMKGPRGQRTAQGAVALFVILVLGSSFGNLSQTALNAMLTLVVGDFGIDIEVGQWLTTIYMLSLGVAVPATTFLSKRLSLRRYTFLSLALFTGGSALDALAPGFYLLVIGRVLQAVSAGFMMPIMQSVAMSRFPPERQGMVMGIAGIAMGFMPNIGPTIGSLFAQTLGWRWFFIILAVLPLVLIAATALKVKDDPSKPSPAVVKLDVRSFALSAVGFGGLLSGLSISSSRGLDSPLVWALIVVGAVVLFCFLRRQRTTQHPLIDLAIFKSKEYKIGFWMQNLLFGSFLGITLVIPLYVEEALGGTSVAGGAVLLPGALTALVFNPLAGILADRFGKARVVRWGAILYCIGALLALFFDENTPLWLIGLFQAIRGMGISTSMSPTITWMLSRLPREIVNDGSSFTVLVRQASASFGTAVMVLLVTLASPAGEILGYRLAFGFSAVLGLVMLAMALLHARDED